MNSRSRAIVEMTQLSFWYFICQPGQNHKAAIAPAKPSMSERLNIFTERFCSGISVWPNRFGSSPRSDVMSDYMLVHGG